MLKSIVNRLTKQTHRLFGIHTKFAPVLGVSTQKIERISGIQKGKRCFIIGTGPSINSMDLAPLKDEYVFTANKGYLLKDRGIENLFGFCVGDQKALDDNYAYIPTDSCHYIFLASKLQCSDSALPAQSIIFDSYRFPLVYHGYLQDNLRNGVYEAHSVMFPLIQIAHHMGFADIYIIGVDLDFSHDNLHFYASSERERRTAVQVSQQRTELMKKGFCYAGKHLRRHGKRLMNAGVGGRLDTIQRVNFHDLF